MQVLLLDKELRTTDLVVQVTPELPVGHYLAELLVVDATGERASASLAFSITKLVIGPVTPVTPVLTPVTPITPITPIRPGRTPRKPHGRKPE